MSTGTKLVIHLNSTVIGTQAKEKMHAFQKGQKFQNQAPKNKRIAHLYNQQLLPKFRTLKETFTPKYISGKAYYSIENDQVPPCATFKPSKVPPVRLEGCMNYKQAKNCGTKHIKTKDCTIVRNIERKRPLAGYAYIIVTNFQRPSKI